MSQSPCHTRRLLLAACAAVLLITPSATAQATVQGDFTAASFDLGTAPTELGAYLVGMKQGTDAPPSYRWSFEASHVEVVQEIRKLRSIGGAADVWQGNDTLRTHHNDGSGLLRDAGQLAYVAVLSEDPSDPLKQAVVEARLTRPDLTPSERIIFDSRPENMIKMAPEGDSQFSRFTHERDWPNLEHVLDGHADPLVLRGDFRFIVYDMDFTIDDADGSTQYRTGNVGYRGLDPAEPIYDYNDTRAELILHDAVLTLHPAAHPVHFFLATADFFTQGSVGFREAHGNLDVSGQSVRLERAHVRLDGEDLQVRVKPHGHGPTMRLGVEVSGAVDEASVDGRRLALHPATTVPAEPLVDATGALAAAALIGMVAVAARTAPLAEARWLPDRSAKRAERALSRGWLHRAKRRAACVLHHHPRHVGAAAAFGCAMLKQGTPATAADFLAAFIDVPGDEGQISLLHAMCVQATGDTPAARRELARATARHPALRHALAGTNVEDQAVHGGDLSLV